MRLTRVGSINERFSQRFVIDQVSGCWNWIGTSDNHGYGVIAGTLNGAHHKKILAHRASWIIFYGPIPDGDGAHGTVVMHKCDNKLCVNPNHLQLGTQADNVKDMMTKRRHVVGEKLKQTGINHFKSKITRQEDVDLICSGKHSNAYLAELYDVSLDVIKRVKRQNGAARKNPEKFANKSLPPEAIAHIRSTPPGTRGLGKLYGVGKTTIANIRKGLTYAC